MSRHPHAEPPPRPGYGPRIVLATVGDQEFWTDGTRYWYPDGVRYAEPVWTELHGRVVHAGLVSGFAANLARWKLGGRRVVEVSGIWAEQVA